MACETGDLQIMNMLWDSAQKQEHPGAVSLNITTAVSPTITNAVIWVLKLAAHMYHQKCITVDSFNLHVACYD